MLSVLASAAVPQVVAMPAASADAVSASLVRTIALSSFSPPSPDPAGIAYLPADDQLLVADSEVDEMSIFQQANLFHVTLAGNLDGTGKTTAYSNEPAGLSFDPASGHLFVSDDVLRKVFEVAPGVDGAIGTADDTVVRSFSTAAYGNVDPEDVAFDTDTGDLYVSDGIGAEVYHVSPGPNGVFDGVPPTGDDTASHFDVGRFGAEDSEGLAYDASRDTLLVVDRNTDTIYEMHKAGLLVNVIDISAALANHPADVALAPASDAPDRMNLFIVARGEDNDRDPLENDGMLYEMSVDLPPIGNLQPIVEAGPNQGITLPGQATLSGSVADDGLPSGTLTTTWSQVSGPGTATIADPSALATTVSFSVDGTYVLRLTADDSAFQSTDDVTVFVAPQGTTIVQRPVAAGYDDAEEAGGSVNLGSQDLELVNDGSRGNQTVGMRFTGVTVPNGAVVTNAYVQFQADRVTMASTSLTIQGQAADNAGRFTRTTANISSRPRTGQSVAWSPAPPWVTPGAAGADERTSNIAPVVQEIVDRPGWASGNALVIIVTGSGKRAAESFNGNAPPILHVEYAGAGQNQAPTVNAGPDQQLTLPAHATMAGSVSDDGQPDPPGALTTTWSLVSGPQTVTFGDPSSPSTTVAFFEAGTYVLRLTADDSALQTTDDVTITVNAASANLVGNPGFEVDTAGWNVTGSGAGVTLSRVPGGRSGAWSAQLSNGGAAGAVCKLNDQPNWVTSTSAGTYTGSLWARADSSGATLRLRLREYTGGVLVGAQSASLQLSTSWQQVTVSYVPQLPGTSSLDLQAWIPDAPVGVCFYTDDVAITRS